MPVLDDYAQQLASLKKQYTPGNTDIANQGIALRQQAANSGVNLQDLENTAYKDAFGSPLTGDNQKNAYDYVNSLGISSPSGGSGTGNWNYTPSTANLTAPVLPSSQASPSNPSSQNYLQQAAGMIPGLQSSLNEKFNYNPASDPSYQSYKALADQNANLASKKAMETLNDRGIVNSSITGSQLGQIQQQAQVQADAVIPQLQQNAFNQWQTGLQNRLNMMNMLQGYGTQQQQMGLQQFAQTAPYMYQTAEQKAIMPLQWTQAMGTVPNYTNNTAYNQPNNAGMGSGAGTGPLSDQLNNAGFRNSEIQRAQQVIGNRKAAGLPTDDQEAYLYTLLTQYN